MEKHLLVAVSEKSAATRTLQFLGGFFARREDVKVTLFYTATRPPHLWEGERNRDNIRQSEKLGVHYQETGRRVLQSAKNELLRCGFDRDRIEPKLKVRQYSKVLDIIQEAESGLYDAVVLGRRGLSWLEKTFEESVTEEFLKSRLNFPVWICRHPETGRKGVLVCVDGSQAAYRAVDHVGFILSQEDQHPVTLLFVRKKEANIKTNPEEVFANARGIMLKAGLAGEMINERVIEGEKVSRVILREAEKEKVAAVATGRTGAGQGRLKSLLVGSVSRALFQNVEKTALWICY